MAAVDYGSTARALSLPISPNQSPSPPFFSSGWYSRRRRSDLSWPSAYSNQQSHSRSTYCSIRDNLIDNADKFQRRLTRIYEKLSPLQRGLVVAFGLLNLVLVILFFIYSEKIFGFLKPYAVSWKAARGGWTILWALTFLSAFPPVIGYSTWATLAGFVFGVGEGWLILASASVVGSTCAFLVSRSVLRGYVERLVAHDKRFAALTLTLKHDGLRLLCMIRLCPLPYSLSNGAISTFPSVHPLMYGLATAIVSPKLLIPAFIGSRLSDIGEHGGQMSLGAKAVNWTSIIFSGLIAVSTGWYIYQRTMARSRQLEAEESAKGVQSSNHHRRSSTGFSDDPEAAAAAAATARFRQGDGDIVDFLHEGSVVGQDSYRDEVTGDDGDVFDLGDGDEDAIDLDRQWSK